MCKFLAVMALPGAYDAPDLLLQAADLEFAVNESRATAGALFLPPARGPPTRG
ncbi:MAG: hypothetical protein KDA42_08360 [Planctomycetales bacterium]|nr:hypothetical protein [Planctomycetales bacterium]